MTELAVIADKLLRVAPPRGRNSATVAHNHATGHATAAQQPTLKALALLALERNNTRNNGAAEAPKVVQQTGASKTQSVALAAAVALLHFPEGATAQQGRLRKAANALEVDPAGILAAAAGSEDEIAQLDAAGMRAYARALHDTALRAAGKCPDDETAPALCARCGPVWLALEVTAVAPIVAGWPRVLGCPWCHVQNRRSIPRPPVACGDCKHFVRDAINPDGGMGSCTTGRVPKHNEPLSYPHARRQCARHVPNESTRTEGGRDGEETR